MKSSTTLKLLFFILIAFFSCTSSEQKKANTSSVHQFQEYISGTTTGYIKRSDPIVIKFSTNVVSDEETGKPVPGSVLGFSPKIAGTASWISPDALEFTPAEPLNWNTSYTATLNLGKIVNVPYELKKFQFEFHTPEKQFSVNHSGLSISEKGAGEYTLKGVIETSDVFNSDEIEKILSVSFQNKPLDIKWEHNPKAYLHSFTVNQIVRGEKETKLQLKWDGGKIDVQNNSNEIELTVPSLNNFEMVSAKIINKPDQLVEILFSDPINPETDLRGFIQIDNTNLLQYKIEYNLLKIYPQGKLTGMHTLKLSGAIESTLGYKLKSEVTHSLNFGGIPPQVKLLGNGVIVPQSEGLYFPFEAVGLSAVDVRITKIFTNNIHSFLQESPLDQSWGLNQVGRVIHRSKIDLSNKGASDLNSWNAFNLDLSKLIEVETGAIYNVEIGFRKSYSLFNCENNSEEVTQFVPIEEEEQYPEKSYKSIFWSYEYNWQLRDAPCSQSYYSPEKFVNRNILGSNFGIIVKVSQNKTTSIYITNLITAAPESNVTVKMYDYQNQLLFSGNTNSDGMLSSVAEREPFLLVAQKEKNIGYLKIDNSTNQSTSNFDVEGKSVQKGLKGFIYGERDVWRPGDSVFVSFILEDKQKQLPNEHPLVMEIFNSKGQFVRKMIQLRDEKYIYPFYFKTNPDDPTGNWQVIVKIGAVQFSKTIRIETVKPNRLKVEVNFNDELLSAQKTTSGAIFSKWLHGSPAKGLKAKVDVSFSAYAPTFKNYKAFDFSTPYSNYNIEQTTLFDNTLNDAGEAKFNFSFKPNNQVTGFLKATFTTKVFEKGGDFSINYFSKPFSPYANYVGLKIDWSYKNWNKLDNNVEHRVEVATVDENGNPVSLSNVEVKLFELDYRWWYNSNEENLATYAGKTHHKAVMTTKLNTVNGKGTLLLNKDEERWGRHLLLVTSPNGHTAGQVIYFGYPWGRGNQKGGAQMLALITEQDQFNVGDEVTVSFPANKEARALITFENGSGIIAQEWVKNLSDFTHYKFKATSEMAPNIYVHVTLLQPHAQTANDLPIRLYGVIPIMVEDPKTRLHPKIEMPDEVRPLKEFTIQVSEGNKQAMDYTIAIVDDGLLDITNFKTPDPWTSFFSREALGISTYDLYNFVMGAFGSRLESMFAIGGSDINPDHSKKKSERFKPVVKVLGPFHLKANSKASHKITLPQYVGSVRIMVIAAENGKYGNTEKTTPVREPLMVLATLPRVLSPGETVDLPVSVFAMNASVKKVSVKISTNNLLQIQGNSDSTITFNELGEKDLFFKVKSASNTGIAKVKVEVTSEKEKSFHEIELDIRQPNLPSIETTFRALRPNEKWTATVSKFGIEGTNKAQFEISSMPPLNLGYRLQYLISYPHGCIEQTTSALFPQLFLPELFELKQEEIDKIHYNISKGIEKLQRFQLPDGSFAYWPGSTQSSVWASSYAGHFLIEAQRAGYMVPGNMKSEWLKYMRRAAQDYTSTANNYHYKQYAQAYLLYLLAKEGETQMSAMNRLRSETNLDVQTKWLLAGAYALAGMKEAAYQLIDFRNMKPGISHDENYGSYLRDLSVILQTTIVLNELEQAARLALEISEQLSSAEWYSTQTTAYSLVALSSYAKVTGAGKELKYRMNINGKTTNQKSNRNFETVDLNFNNSNQHQIEIENKGESTLFVNLSNEGVKPGIDTEVRNDGIDLLVSYHDQQGNKIDPAELVQGTDFIAKVTAYNKNVTRIKNVALSQLFPAGWEIINSRLFTNESSVQKNSIFDFQDFRDDRVFTYFELAGYETKTFVLNLNASYSGEFLLAPVTCSAMYNRAYFAKVPGMKVKVVKK